MPSTTKLPASAEPLDDALVTAIREGEIEVIHMAIRAGQNVNARAKNKATMLHFAASCGKQAIAELLIKNGADLDLEEENERTPLFIATMKKNEDVAIFLLQKTKKFTPDKRKDTVLHLAYRNGMLKLVADILKSEPYLLSCKNENGDTPLMNAYACDSVEFVRSVIEQKAVPNGDSLLKAAETGKDEVVKMLLNEMRINPDAKTTTGRPPLHIAASRGHAKVVKLLLDAKAKVDGLYIDNTNLKKPHTTSPLMVAARNGHREIVDQLIDAKASVNLKTTETALVLASWSQSEKQKNNIDVINTLLAKKADVNGVDGSGNTALTMAANRNCLPIIKRLLDAKADIEKTTPEGYTPLFAAVLRDQTSAVESLLDAKANIEKTTPEGHTPLFMAVLRNKVPAATLLLSHRANPNVRDNNGKTLFAAATSINKALETAIMSSLRGEPDSPPPRLGK